MSAFNKVIFILLIISAVNSKAGDTFTGTVKLACEAILCLSSSSPPDECKPSLKRYFSISFDSAGKTARERKKFLNQCPVK